jgi:hypothetical protein
VNVTFNTQISQLQRNSGTFIRCQNLEIHAIVHGKHLVLHIQCFQQQGHLRIYIHILVMLCHEERSVMAIEKQSGVSGKPANPCKYLDTGFVHSVVWRESPTWNQRRNVLVYLQTADILMNAYKDTTGDNETSLSEAPQLSLTLSPGLLHAV